MSGPSARSDNTEGGVASGDALGRIPPDHGENRDRDYADYPVVLSVEGRLCLVVGAGPVAARKASGLLACGARLTVIALEVGDAMEDLLEGAPPGRVRLERRPYRDGEAAGYELVVSATGDDAVDGRVTADALVAGALVNGAPTDSVRSVHLPAVHREGPVTVAVSTAGESPALAAWLRRRVAHMGGPDLAVLAGLLSEARQGMRHDDMASRAVDWAEIIDRLVPFVEAGRIEEARSLLRRIAGP